MKSSDGSIMFLCRRRNSAFKTLRGHFPLYYSLVLELKCRYGHIYACPFIRYHFEEASCDSRFFALFVVIKEDFCEAHSADQVTESLTGRSKYLVSFF